MTTSNSVRWRLVILIAAFPVLAAGLYVLLAPRVYRAEVLMVPVIAQSEQQSAGAGVAAGLSSIAAQFGMGGVTGASDAEQEAIATLTSRAFLEAFVVENNLLPVLFSDEWDVNANRWLTSDAEDEPTIGDAYKKLTEEVVSVSKDLRSGLVTLKVDWTDRHMAADWATELTARVNEKMRQRAISEATDSLKHLFRELESNSQFEIQQAIYRIAEWNLTQRTLANVNVEYAFRTIDPAVVADEDDFIRPQRLVILVVGVLLGALVGLCAAIWWGLVDFRRLLGASGESTR